MTKEIQLTQGKVAKVSDDWFEYLNQFKWHAHRDGNRFYAARHSPTVNGKRTVIKMHREVMNAHPGEDVDHVDNNGLDNRKENLRFCTNAENLRNRGKQSDNTSGFKGVTWHKQLSKWHVRIMANGKNFNLGLYTNLEDAARAYDEAAREYHGEFAKTNFIE